MSKYIIPYKLFLGAHVPNWLLCRTELTLAAKLCYAKLAQYAGKRTECYPSITRLANDLGISKRQIIRSLQQLTEIQLIEKIQVGKKCNNRYKFLAHKWFFIEESTPKGGDKMSLGVVTKCHFTGDKMSLPIVRESCNKNITIQEGVLNTPSTNLKVSISEIVYTYYNTKDIMNEQQRKFLYPRTAKSAHKLYLIANTDTNLVKKILRLAPYFFDKKGLSWTIETILKYWHELINYKEVKYE